MNNETLTEKGKAQLLYISLIPLVVIILIIIGAGYFLLADEIKLPKFDEGPQIRRLEGFPTIVYTDRVLEKQRKIITSQDELNQFLNEVDPTGLLTLKDEINFEKELVLAVTSETESQDEHKIKIKKVYEDKEDQSILVSIEETFPGDTCEVEEAPHIAVEVATIDKTEYEIEFERLKKVVECN